MRQASRPTDAVRHAPAHAGWRIVAERVAWTIALVCLSAWAALNFSGSIGRRLEMHRFAAMRAGAPLEAARPDQSLWSVKRIQAWQDTLRQDAPPPLAVLRVPKIDLEVPVLEGTDDWTLNRAVGHIAGTSAPGTDGNSGIAGHRDGFFRGLKDIAVGDAVELETVLGVERYRIARTWIVYPKDVWVLDRTPSRAVTLVTCYPFYFIGSAPQRFIVRAVHE
jgi:sortase A